MSVMADGCYKCYHYANAGRMQLGDVATSTSFFGEVARKVQDDFADGTVTSAAQQKYAQHCATVAAGDDDSSYSCSSNLSCSRASASARGVVDIAGTAGVSCAHGQPGRGLFVAMPTPEQHTYHIRTLLEALKRRPDIRDIYIDIGCRLKGALMEAVRLLVAGGKLEASVLERASAAHRAWGIDSCAHHLCHHLCDQPSTRQCAHFISRCWPSLSPLSLPQLPSTCSAAQRTAALDARL